MYLQNQYEERYGSGQIDMLYDWTTNERHTNSTCYSISFVFGAFQYNHTYNENITMMSCYQDIEMVNTTATFLPSMLIDTSNPPIVHEESRQTIRPNVLYQLSALLDTNLLDFHLAGVDNAPGTSGSYTYHGVAMSPLYQAIIYGVDGIPASELIGERNQDRLYNATLHMYRKYMAVLIHNNMREPLALSPAPQEAATPESYSGQIITSTALRVVQDPQSALVLQIMLAVVLALMAMAYLLTPMRNVLRHSPCTIAGVMSLLAGSDLCTRAVIPEGAEYMTDKELEGVFDGYQFSLGWFSSAGEAQGQARNERFGIDMGKAQRCR